jgi:hypothetical protein
LQIHTQAFQNDGGASGGRLNDAQQDMFSTYVLVPQALGFSTGELEHVKRTFGKDLCHRIQNWQPDLGA